MHDLEQRLPRYLLEDIRRLQEAPKDNCDCEWCEVYGSINTAMVDGVITEGEAASLRAKYLNI